MVKRLKQILVDSYVGAIALAVLFAQAVGHFANMLATSTTNWLIEGPYRASSTMPYGFRVQSTVPEMVRGLFQLLILGLLLYWLYFPLPQREPERTESPAEIGEQSGEQ